MKRVRLRDVPVDPFPEPEVEIKCASYYLTADVHKIGRERVLVSTFHNVRQGVSEFRVFSTSKEFMTQLLCEDKWSSSMVEKLLPYDWDSVVSLDKRSNEAGVEFYGYKENTLEALVKFQRDLRSQQLADRHREYRNRVDKAMSGVRDIPKRFMSWVDDAPLLASRYIFYKRRNRTVADGFCTHCLRKVTVESPKHNESGSCPKCNSSITFKAKGKSRKVKDKAFVSLIQKGKGPLHGDLVVRWFEVIRDFTGDQFRNPETYLCEKFRTVIHPDGKTNYYEWRTKFNTLEHEFDKEDWNEPRDELWPHDSHLYPHNLAITLKGTNYEYCKIKEFSERRGLVDTRAFLAAYAEGPALEYLVNLELDNLVTEMLDHRSWSNGRSAKLKGRSMKEVLGVGKRYIPMIQKHNITANELELIQKAVEYNRPVTEELLRWNKQWMDGTSNLALLAKYMTLEKAQRYLSKQSSAKSMNYVARDYYDYLRNCEDLGIDTKNKSVLFPKDLNVAHDRVSDLMKKKNNAHLDPAIAKLEEPINKTYAYQDKQFMVRAPKGIDEIIDEGSRLSHCVGTYLERIAKGETIILFIRQVDSPGDPYFTMEVSEDLVRQVRGLKNCAETPEVKRFVDKWKQAVLFRKRHVG